MSSPARPATAERLVSVAVPVPRLGLLTYQAPPGTALAPGMRVRVPLGSRALIGFIASIESDAARIAAARAQVDAKAAIKQAALQKAHTAKTPKAKPAGPALAGAAPASTAPAGTAPGGIKAILEVLDQEPLIPEDVLRLALWTADYYLCGPGETLAAASPPFARGRRFAFKQQRVARLARPVAPDDTLTPKQADALARLAEVPDGILVAALQKRDISAAVLGGLARRGLIVIEDEVIERDPFIDDEMARAGESPFAITPTGEQQRVLTELQRLASRETFDVALLHGVTGSGKTQVYLRLADAVRRTGGRVLMLVPEISLTPAMAAVFRRAFGDRVAIQHSGLSDGERHDQWHRIRRGDVDIVVGTRSAVFAPVPSLGLIVVDEEHDSSYKQEESPRYHGRDVAIMRAKQANAFVLLGSATPSLETYQHALAGRYRHLALERRVLDRPLAAVRRVDMREVYAEEGPDVILSAPLRESLQQRLEANEQSLILLNRRGYAAAIFCRQCAATLECPNCSVTLTIHRASSRARCHYCDHEARVPETCAKCGGEFLEYRGFGTERIEAEVKAAWPEARVARVDRDTVRRRGAIARLLHRFAQRELDILIGTQMIAKGHDFPEVTLVGVISADIGLGVADFRAAERTFQLLTQVVGRAGRGVRQGEAIIQTLYPHHYSVDHASRQDYRAFFEAELRYRKAMHYPPVLSLINVIVRGPSLEAATRDARLLVRALGAPRPPASHAAAAAGADPAREPFYVLGPARAPLAKLRGEHRAQFFLKGTQRNVMRQAIAQALARHPEIARRTSVDVDPLSML